MRIVFFFQEALRNIKGHRLLSVATTMSLVLILTVFGLFLLTFFNLRNLGHSLREQWLVTAYLEDGLSEGQILAIQREILDTPGVEAVDYVSKEQALLEFEGRLPERVTLLEGLGENPLPASLDIKLNGAYQETEEMVQFVRRVQGIGGVEEVQAGLEWLDRFTSLFRLFQGIGVGAGIFLAIVVVAIASNTIRLSIYARQEEIVLMRLLGAKEGFIRAPFFIEGGVVGLSAAVLSLLFLWGGFVLFERQLGARAVGLSAELPLSFFSLNVLVFLLLLALFLGGLGGYFSVRHTRRAGV